MKKLVLSFYFIFILSLLNAQVAKVLNVTAGKLSEKLTSSEKSTITDLTLTGTIDARDFKTMRDGMPKLANIDLSGVSIVSYSGADGTSFEEYYNVYSANTIPRNALSDSYKLTDQRKLKAVIIPNSINVIGVGSFSDCSELTSINIPNSVGIIGQNAFWGCSKFQKVEVPSSVFEIDFGAFVCSGGDIQVDENSQNYSSQNGLLYTKDGLHLIHCPVSKKGEITLPDKVEVIGNNAFSGCSMITAISMSDQVKSIEAFAFHGCSAITSFILPNNLTKISTGTFHSCISLKELNIPSSVVELEDISVLGCTGLETIRIPYSVNKIGRDAFSGSSGYILVDSGNSKFSSFEGDLYNKDRTLLIHCNFKKGTFSIPDKVQVIGSNAFSSNVELTEVKMPDSVTKIEELAFVNCKTLKVIHLSNKIDTISNYVFGSCFLLDSIALPASIKYMGDNLFIGCYSLRAITSLSKVPYDISNYPNFFDGVNGANSILYIPSGSLLAYRSALYWRDFYNIVELPFNYNIETMAGELSQHIPAEVRDTLSTLTITGTIDARDFRFMRDSMPQLVTLNISKAQILAYSGTDGTWMPSNSSYPPNAIPDCAFYNPWGNSDNSILKDVTLPTLIDSIGRSAFAHCLNLRLMDFPESLSAIGSYAFWNCLGFTSVSIPDRFTRIEEGTFMGCQNLESIHIPSSISFIGGSAFAYCKNIVTISIPSTISVLSEAVFLSCENLSSITIPNTIKGIDNFALSQCYSLESVNIPSSVESIGVNAFRNDKLLKTVKIPNSVNNIKDGAFSFCGELDSIYSYRNVPVDLSSSSLVFEYVDKANCVLSVPYGSKELYASANQWKDFHYIVEMAPSPELNVVAGKLNTLINQTWRDTLTTLILTGTIDARDFRFMRDSLPELTNLDLSGVSISAYAGTDGTQVGQQAVYYANEVPFAAFQKTAGIIKLEEIDLPKSITKIGEWAFYGCDHLNNIDLSGTLETLGAHALANCIAFGSISIPKNILSIETSVFIGFVGDINVDNENPNYSSVDGVLFNKDQSIIIQCPVSRVGRYTVLPTVTEVGFRAFLDCDKLTSIELPSKLEWIDAYAFAGDTSLVSINFPTSLKWIQGYAFDYCINLKSISFPSQLTRIDQCCFEKCPSLEPFTIPSTLTDIGQYAFRYSGGDITVSEKHSKFSSENGVLYNKDKSVLIHCPVGKKNTFYVASYVREISDYSFSECINLDSIIVSESVEKIGVSAFNYCLNLKTVLLSKNISKIEDDLFMYCKNLESIKIPEKVDSIGAYVFAECVGLGKIYAYKTNPIDLSQSSQIFWKVDRQNCKLYVPAGTVSSYRNAVEWRDFYNILEMPHLSVSVDSLYLKKTEGSSAYFSVNSNANWTATADENWLTIQPSSGNSSDTLQVIAAANPLSDRRMATVTIRVDDNIYETVKVYQEGNAFLTVDPAAISFDGSLNDVDTVNVTSNVNWTYSWNADWLSVVKPEANPSMLILTSNVNSTINPRETTVVLSSEKVGDKTITVQQTAGDTIFAISQNVVWLGFTAGSSDTIELQSNVNWSLEKDADWLSVNATSGSGNKTIILSASENSSLNKREGVIKIIAAGLDTISIDVNQRSEPKLTVGVDSVFLSKYEGSLFAISLYSNTDWQVSSDASWLNVTPLSGTNSDTIVIVASKNPLVTKRKAKLVFKANGVEDQVVHVIQSEGDPRFIVADSAIVLEAANNSHDTIIIDANIPWNIELSADWLNASLMQGDSSAKVVISAIQNYKPVERETSFTISGNSQTYEIKVVQNACTPSLLADAAELFIGASAGSVKNLKVSSTLEWTASINVSWLVISPQTGAGDKTLKLTAQANPVDSVRTAIVTLMADSVADVIVTIHQYEKKVLTVSADTIYISGKENTNNEFNIVSNANWSIASNKTWLGINPKTGTGNQTVSVSAGPNTTLSDQNAIITVSSESAPSQQIVVIQEKGDLIFNVSDTLLNVAALEGSKASLNLTTNDSWSIESKADWFSVSSQSGVGNKTITVTAKENFDLKKRLAIFTIKCSEGKAKEITITQNAGEPTLQIAENELFLEFIDGSNTTLEITSNLNWIINSITSWLSFAKPNGSGSSNITVTASQNNNKENREAVFSVSADGMDSIFVHVTQGGLPWVEVNVDSVFVSSHEDGFVAFAVNSNTNWNITSDKNWLSFKPDSGNGNKMVYVTAENNNFYERRIAKIEVQANYVNPVELYIIQSKASLQFNVSDSSIVFEAEGGNKNFDIASNASWTIDEDANWLSINSDSGKSDAQITLTAEENQSIFERTATISVIVDAYNSKQILIKQNGVEPYLNLSATSVELSDSAGSFAVVDLTSNASWVVQCNEDWLSVTPNQSFGDSSLAVTANENLSTESRMAVLEISINGIVMQTITVIQIASQKNAVYNYFSGSLKIFPNPVDNGFQIVGCSNNTVIQIINIDGKIIRKLRVLQNDFVSCEELQEGTYFIQIDGSSKQIKFVKE